jgi:uncharacterized protein (DUF1778 family)
MGNKEKRRSIRLDLGEKEYQELKEWARTANIPTKTYTEFIMNNVLREAEQSKENSFLGKLKSFFMPRQ